MPALTRTRSDASAKEAARVIKAAVKAGKPSLPSRVGRSLVSGPAYALYGAALVAFIVAGVVRRGSAAGRKAEEFRKTADANTGYRTSRPAAPGPNLARTSEDDGADDEFDADRDGTV